MKFTFLLFISFITNIFSEELIFFDNFDNFNLDIWDHEITMSGGGNNEFQYYLNNRTNSYVSDSLLHIYPSFTSDIITEKQMIGSPENPFVFDISGQCNNPQFFGCSKTSNGHYIINPITSARINTKKSFWFKYGRVEFKAKLPKGKWLWPAFWLLPKYEEYGPWPASGEIDFLESRGNGFNYKQGGYNSFSSTLHWGPILELDSYNKTYNSFKYNNNKNFNDDFQTFGLIWTRDKIQTYLNDPKNIIFTHNFNEKMWDYGDFNKYNVYNPWINGDKNAPFDKEFYIIINLAVGGTNTYFPDDEDNKPWKMSDDDAALKFWNNKDTWFDSWFPKEKREFQIDYIKVWKFSDSTFNTKKYSNSSSSNNNNNNIGQTIVLIISFLTFIFFIAIMFKKYFKKDSKENCNDKNRNKNYVKYRFGNYKSVDYETIPINSKV